MKRHSRFIVVLLALSLMSAFDLIDRQAAGELNPYGSELSLKYPFISFEKNELTLPSKADALYEFHRLTEQVVYAGKGKVNIFHIGGSHVQAGVFGNRMRENFMQLTHNVPGERGFLFPYKAANTNGPSHVFSQVSGKWEACRSALASQQCDWGLAGIQATTTDTLAGLKLWTNTGKDLKYSFNRVKIFHPGSENEFCIEPSGAGYLSLRRDNEGGYTELLFSQMSDTLSIQFRKRSESEVSFTLQGLRFENNLPGLTYNEIGVNGASVPSYLRSPHFEKQLAVQPADLVVFGIGINDAHKPIDEFNKETFKQNYRELIARFRRANSKANFVFITNNDSYYSKKPNKNAITVRQAMLELAEENNCAVWDFFEIMGGLGSIAQWQKAGLAKSDKIHFTASGYELMADLLFGALQKDFMRFLRSEASDTKSELKHG